MKKLTTIQLFKNIKTLVEQSRRELYNVANITLVETYFHIGRLIVEYEQQGSSRAGYAKETLKNLSGKLTDALGKGFSVDNLENMRKFYTVYKDDYNRHVSKNEKSKPVVRKFKSLKKSEAVPRKLGSLQKSEAVPRKLELSPFKLSWTNYVLLLRIEDGNERKFYEIEATNETWSSRELLRQYDSALYQRLALSRDKKKVKELSKKGHVIEKPSDVIKDPYILEFLDLPQKEAYSENDLETAIIDKLRCFVLIDLKICTLQHKDLGQTQMYVNYYDEEIKAPEENKTIGIILCRHKKDSTIKYTLGKDNKQIFASKYRIYFPEKQLLKIVKETP